MHTDSQERRPLLRQQIADRAAEEDHQPGPGVPGRARPPVKSAISAWTDSPGRSASSDSAAPVRALSLTSTGT
ncbi:hypothetical protein SCALM49S_09662 [Streptomyces californicus]